MTFLEVNFPTEKRLVCPTCKNRHDPRSTRYTWRDGKFHFACEKCGALISVAATDTPAGTPTHKIRKLVDKDPLGKPPYFETEYRPYLTQAYKDICAACGVTEDMLQGGENEPK
mgnify:CR=1 FL=1